MKTAFKIEDTEQFSNLTVREVMAKIENGEIGTPIAEDHRSEVSGAPKLRVVQGGKKD